MSKIIVVEGPDRVGKQTQTRLLQEYITRTGLGAVVVEVPIRSAVTYRVIYWMLQNGLAKKFPKIFQWFQFLNRKIFQMFALSALERYYDYIIMDRWSLSTVVYGAAEGVSKEYTLELAKRLREPDYTIILHGKSHSHEAEDSYESDSELQQKVRIEYARWAFENPARASLVNCNNDKKIIARQIQEALQLNKILPRH